MSSPFLHFKPMFNYSDQKGMFILFPLWLILHPGMVHVQWQVARYFCNCFFQLAVYLKHLFLCVE